MFVVGDGIRRGLAQHNVRAQEGQDIGSIQIIENASAELAAASAAEGELAVASAPASANANPHLSFCLHRKPCVLCALLHHRRHGCDHVHMRPSVGSVRGPCWQLLMGFCQDAPFAEARGTVLMLSTADTIHIILPPFVAKQSVKTKLKITYEHLRTFPLRGQRTLPPPHNVDFMYITLLACFRGFLVEFVAQSFPC